MNKKLSSYKLVRRQVSEPFYFVSISQRLIQNIYKLLYDVVHNTINESTLHTVDERKVIMAPYILYSVLCWLFTSIMYGLMIEFHTSPLEATLCYLGFVIHLYSSYTLNRVHMILQVKHICTVHYGIFLLKSNCIILIVVEESEVFITRIYFRLYQEI